MHSAIVLQAHLDLEWRGGGTMIFCPEKLHNAQLCKRWNWETKLQEKQKGFSTILSSTETYTFKPRILDVLYWQV